MSQSQQAVIAQKTEVKTPAYAWVVLFALYMATLASPLNLFKLPPVMTIIMEQFKLNGPQAGYLMSIFSIMGFVLAIPAGYILKRFGIKLTGLVSVGAVTVGSAVGALATTARMLFVGRFIEGVGMGLIMVAAPLAISLWFPAQKRALPTGIWASSVGIGNVATLRSRSHIGGSPRMAGRMVGRRRVFGSGVRSFCHSVPFAKKGRDV